MKVKELIRQLKAMPQEAEVKIYEKNSCYSVFLRKVIGTKEDKDRNEVTLLGYGVCK